MRAIYPNDVEQFRDTCRKLQGLGLELVEALSFDAPFDARLVQFPFCTQTQKGYVRYSSRLVGSVVVVEPREVPIVES